MDTGCRPARRPGEALFLTEVPGGLAVTRSEGLTAEARDVAAGDGESLADDEALAALGSALDDERAYSAKPVRPCPEADLAGQVAGGGPGPCDTSLEGQALASATGIADEDGPVVLAAMPTRPPTPPGPVPGRWNGWPARAPAG